MTKHRLEMRIDDADVIDRERRDCFDSARVTRPSEQPHDTHQRAEQLGLRAELTQLYLVFDAALSDVHLPRCRYLYAGGVTRIPRSRGWRPINN